MIDNPNTKYFRSKNKKPVAPYKVKNNPSTKYFRNVIIPKFKLYKRQDVISSTYKQKRKYSTEHLDTIVNNPKTKYRLVSEKTYSYTKRKGLRDFNTKGNSIYKVVLTGKLGKTLKHKGKKLSDDFGFITNNLTHRDIRQKIQMLIEMKGYKFSYESKALFLNDNAGLQVKNYHINYKLQRYSITPKRKRKK